MPTVKEVIAQLKRYNKLTDHIVADIWTTQDVIDHAADNDITLTREQAQEILTQVDKNRDANFGVTWDTLDMYTDRYLSEAVGERKVAPRTRKTVKLKRDSSRVSIKGVRR